jgi:hypothetical protein
MRRAIASAAMATVLVPCLATGPNPATATPAADGGTAMTAVLMKAGKLPANNRRDLLDVRTLYPRNGASRTAIAARDGKTGRQLWRTTFKGKVPLKLFTEPVGADGKRGVVRVVHRTHSMTLQALSGVDGHQLWEQTVGGAGKHRAVVPGEISVVRGAGGSANYLVELVTTTGTGTVATPEVVSGVDGSVSTLGEPITSNRFADIHAIPDVSGDGLGDVLVVVNGPDGFVRAEDGVTGTSLWTDDRSMNHATAVAIGAFSQSKTSDIAVYDSDPDTDPTCNGDDAVAPCPGSTVTVIQGNSGSVLWTRSATTILPIRTAGDDHVPAVLVASLRARHDKEDAVGSYHFNAVTPTNHVIYHKAIQAFAKKLPHQRRDAFGSLRVLGDAQPDGSRDLTFSLRISAKARNHTNNVLFVGLFDGRRGSYGRFPGHADPDLAARAPAAGSLHKGSGTDLIQLTNTKAGRPRITTWDGKRHKRLYSRVVPVSPGYYGPDEQPVFGVRVSGHRCSQIAIQTTGDGGSHVLSVLNARARVLWSLSFKRFALKGGTLVHHAAGHLCVS